MRNPKCSLIISTYNWPEALRLCVNSALIQSHPPSEIIIADDGSGEETRSLIESLKSNTSIPIIHVWHADEGFRLAAIRNKSIAASSFPYTIQIDGDIILHPDFIKDHLSLAEEGYFVTGGRVLLSETLSKEILAKGEVSFVTLVSKSRNLFNHFRNRLIRNFLSHRYKTSEKYMYYVKGCNMAFWRKDLLLINGYDEDFVGWGREDSEIAIRLYNAGIKKKYLKMGGIEYHLYHKEADRSKDERNTALLQRAISENKKWCSNGINKYL
jgi:glycosyltransferase involved in cell wall biosynthesis